MQNLKYNIEVLEQIEKEYNSVDYFVSALKPMAIAILLARTESPYKLKQMRVALVLEYLRNVGIDTAKPDVHIIRVLKRLGYINQNSSNEEKQALDIIEKMSIETGIPISKIDFLLWHYCSEDFCNICSANPKCNICVIKKYCKESKMSILDEIEEFVKTLPIDYEFSTKWFKTELSRKYHRSEDSYIPSDYCYNRKNNGIIYEEQPHYFLYIKQGKYKYVGKEYVFNGIPVHNPKQK